MAFRTFYIHKRMLLNVTCLHTKYFTQIVSMPDLYSGCPRFKFQPGYPDCFLWISSVPPDVVIVPYSKP